MRRPNNCLVIFAVGTSSVPSTGTGNELASNGCEASLAGDVGAAAATSGLVWSSQSIIDGVLDFGVIHLKGMDKPLVIGDAGALAAYDCCTLALRDLGTVGDAFDVAPHNSDCFLDRSSTSRTLPLGTGDVNPDAPDKGTARLSDLPFDTGERPSGAAMARLLLEGGSGEEGASARPIIGL